MDDAFLVGCCGWPEGKPKYFARFPVVELQTTFYEPPSVALARKWRDLAPPDFQFCLKAWQLITHTPASPTYRRLKSQIGASEHDLFGSFRPTEQVRLAWERTADIARALRARVVVFQCPASFRCERENIKNFTTFFERLEREDFRLAWEPRGDWPDETVQKLSSEFDLLHCVDPFQRESVYGHPVYWRLHGRKRYSYRYSESDLSQLKSMASAHIQQHRGPVYVLFNNVWMKDDAARFQAQFSARGPVSER